MAAYSISVLKERIQKFPREPLINTPTPIQDLKNLSGFLKGPEIFIKRDDLTGLAFGGNKSRKLEFIIADVLRKKADAIITWAGVQSNWCLQTAAAAKKYGIIPLLILYRTYDQKEEFDGNLFLDFILDAEIRIKKTERGKVIQESEVEEALAEAVKEVEDWGRSPYIAPIGGSLLGGSMDKPLGAIAYVDAFLEIAQQAAERDIKVDYVIHATGSGSTQAGLVFGAKAISPETTVIGISVSEGKEAMGKDVLTIAQDTEKALGLELGMNGDDIIVLDEYIGEGYGIVNKDVSQAIRFVAQKEGIFLDPVYTGKAWMGLMDLMQKGYFKPDDSIVFLHTGGTPALFPNKPFIGEYLANK